MSACKPSVIWLVASGLLLPGAAPSPTAAARAPGDAAPIAPAARSPVSAPGDPHERPVNPSATRLVADGIRRSYTIGRLVDTIERSDLIVYVHVAAPPDGLPTSQTRLMASGGRGSRYVSVWIDERLLPLARLEMLGHELQHVAEIAEAQDVTDADGLQRLYKRIGYSSWHEHAFESRRAIVVQLQVAQELLANLDPADTPPVAHPSSGDSAAERRRLYDTYCAVCHGRDGKGRGRAQPALSAKPPDLTLLAERNGGRFPRSSVELRIRGSARGPTAAAGDDMPVWTGPLPPGHDAGAAMHADSIVAYIESLQRRPR